MGRPRAAYEILKETVSEFLSERGPRMAAALSFYTLFSLAPVLIIAVAVAGLVFGEDAARTRIVAQVQALIGTDGAQLVEALIKNASAPSSSIPATIIGLIALLVGASGVFGELQDSFNTVWNVAPKPERPVFQIIKRRFVSFAMVFGTGFLLLVSLVLSAGLSALAEWGGRMSPVLLPALRLIDGAVSLLVIALLFALMYKFVPDVKLAWREVLPGAFLTSALFIVGKYALGVYLGRQAFGSAYGAAGSVLVLLLWVYYSSQILLFGAELTQVWSKRRHAPKEGSSVLSNV